MDNRNAALPVTVDIAADHHGSGDDHADALGRIQVARVAESGPQPAEELRLLLRKRLRFVGTLMSVVGLCYVAPNAYLWARHLDAVGRWMPWIVSLYLFWTVTLLVTAVLWSPFPLSVTRLRFGEIILFGTLAAQQLFTLIWLSVGNGILSEELANPKSTFAATINIVWFSLVVGYGVLIPNTGRRCALVVAVLAGLPIGGFFLSGAALPEIWERHRENLIVGTVYIAVWMGVGVALAIYGAQRIE
jgi:hypothetical protein